MSSSIRAIYIKVIIFKVWCNRKLKDRYKSLSDDLVREAFPGLIPPKIETAKAYFDKNGVSAIATTEYSASIFALDYLKTLSTQIIKNESTTGSVDSPLLFQNVVTQSVLTGFTNGSVAGISASIYLVNSLVDVIKATIENPVFTEQPPVELVTNVTIPVADSLSPVVSGKLVLEEGYGFIVSGSTKLSVVLSLLESANE